MKESDLAGEARAKQGRENARRISAARIEDIKSKASCRLRRAGRENIAHADGDQGGRGEQLLTDLEKEEREWKGGDIGLCEFNDGVDGDHYGDIEEAEREVPVEVVWWAKLVISSLWAEELYFGIYER
jgi:hypothetical protein